jgi:protein SCO1/2
MLLALGLSGCQALPGEAATPTPTCAHCEEEVGAEKPQAMSVYNLSSRWLDQDGKSMQLADLKGKVVCLAMVYASCKNACPRLIEDMRALERELSSQPVRFVLVSLDPAVDKPARLKALARERRLGDNWRLLTGAPADVLELSAVLGVKFRKISPTDYAHSNLISVLDRRGVVVHRQEGLGVKPEASVAVVRRLLR